MYILRQIFHMYEKIQILMLHDVKLPCFLGIQYCVFAVGFSAKKFVLLRVLEPEVTSSSMCLKPVVFEYVLMSRQ